MAETKKMESTSVQKFPSGGSNQPTAVTSHDDEDNNVAESMDVHPRDIGWKVGVDNAGPGLYGIDEASKNFDIPGDTAGPMDDEGTPSNVPVSGR